MHFIVFIFKVLFFPLKSFNKRFSTLNITSIASIFNFASQSHKAIYVPLLYPLYDNYFHI